MAFTDGRETDYRNWVDQLTELGSFIREWMLHCVYRLPAWLHVHLYFNTFGNITLMHSKTDQEKAAVHSAVPLNWINPTTQGVPMGLHWKLIHQHISLNLIISCDIMEWGNASNLTMNMVDKTFWAKTTLFIVMQRSKWCQIRATWGWGLNNGHAH